MSERDTLAEVIARTFAGWNDDTSEPDADPSIRANLEAHWEKVNATCLREGRKIADAILSSDVLAEHDRLVAEKAAAEQREKDAAKLDAIAVRTFASANGLDDVTWGQLVRRAAAFDDAAAAIREQGSE